jgi:esterase/lipase
MKAVVQPIDIGRRGGTTLFLIHGYTGSPTDFNDLPQAVHTVLGMRVRVMLLPGHGTVVEDLDTVSYEDFVAAIEEEFKRERQTASCLIVGGVSFGALMALRLAERYQIEGVVSICTPYRLKLPFGLPGLRWLRLHRKYWKKHIDRPERLLRRGSFHYSHMHINGLDLVKRARREVAAGLPRLRCPVLLIHSTSDPLGSVRGIRRLRRRIQSPREVITYHNRNHNIFYSDRFDDVCNHVKGFVERAQARAAATSEQRVAAIVCAYNEASRIVPVLRVLAATPLIDDVIVVDDGSTDGTAAAARSVRGVTVLVNEVNRGKAASLQRGIDHATADTLFFCDADLTGLTTDIVTAIVKPVRTRRRSMFIGVRSNVAQRALTLFALNSGERALRREVWEAVPAVFKWRYRIEVGLNYVAAQRDPGLGWRRFDYYQMAKERKYGLGAGTLLRWWMNFDVGLAYALTVLYRLASWGKAWQWRARHV